MTAKGKSIKKESDVFIHRLSPQKELALAARKFLSIADQNLKLKVLLLVDPIQAYNDVGVTLSKSARKLLRESHPNWSFGNAELYNSVKKGTVKLSWIESIEIKGKKSLAGEGKTSRKTGKEEIQ